ncbi:MAG: ABC transporter ATP-binding protein [Pseudomonadota bacterium]
MSDIVTIRDLKKSYDGGFEALKGVSLSIRDGEILALLGPNGAGKTTLISTICGITSPTSGEVHVGGFDIVSEYRGARQLIGLVPQEITLEPFDSVLRTVRFSRGLFGKPRDEAWIEEVLRRLSLWDKRNSEVKSLSGGMRRRVLIAKALAHEPKVLFLDEPSSGVDVELRRDMWQIVEEMRDRGVTIILTTHYIEEAEAIADRVAVINQGQILLVEDKDKLMRQMGQKEVIVHLTEKIPEIPDSLAPHGMRLGASGDQLIYSFDTRSGERTGVRALLNAIADAGLTMCDLETRQTSLEDIFVTLVAEEGA